MRENRISDDDFMAKCKGIDFSADSQNYEANLTALKGKLTQLEEEKYNMNNGKRFKRPIALIAALVAVLSLSVVAFGDTIWNYIEVRIVQGEEHVNHLRMMTGPTTTGYDEERGAVTSQSIFMIESDIDRDAEGPIVIEVDGRQMVLQDAHQFYDLDEALGHFVNPNAPLPTYLPEGFDFERATFGISPVRHPEIFSSSSNMSIHYSDGQRSLRLCIMHLGNVTLSVTEDGQSVGTDLDFDLEDIDFIPINIEPYGVGTIEINGRAAHVVDGMLALSIGNISYLFDSEDLTLEQLIQIAESLQ